MSEAFGTWLGVGLSAVGLAVSVGGFWIAIAQIRKTRTAVEAYRAAELLTEQRLARVRMSELVAALKRHDEAIAKTANQRNVTAGRLERLFADWRHAASELAGLCEGDEVLGDLVVALEYAISQAGSWPAPSIPGEELHGVSSIPPAREVHAVTDLANRTITRHLAYTDLGE